MSVPSLLILDLTFRCKVVKIECSGGIYCEDGVKLKTKHISSTNQGEEFFFFSLRYNVSVLAYVLKTA